MHIPLWLWFSIWSIGVSLWWVWHVQAFLLDLFLRHALMDLQCSIVIATSGMMQSPAVKGGDKMYHRGGRKVGLFQRIQLLMGMPCKRASTPMRGNATRRAPPFTGQSTGEDTGAKFRRLYSCHSSSDRTLYWYRIPSHTWTR